ncbi:hypothetical protein A3A79_02595 [Candidatus Gottesmanbacteria bacterium RIFCSPLOWO2_01_FULL_43_11b]|uniref:Uncharacterized protein n=1 Tax=Candidatus Gottesmanbacteria bacterium RIFCSPLOWO2_01_FULL_43_11b TaxID=1798392 RepID=A0A1F6AHB0_9BACT|nr:MAG: hypothetical protein A3A79_02595 [Candidatus Gottesmanbacteria bacterium RIFCSPLOWO2_01_FULL_43_11b]
MSTRSVIVWNTGSQIVGKIATTGSIFLVNIFVARLYGVAAYGEFTKILTYIAPFYLLSDFGLNAVFLQKKYPWESLVFLRLFLSLLITFFALALLNFLPQGTMSGYTQFVRFGIVIFLPAIIFQGLLTSANAFFQQKLRYDLSTVALIAGSTVFLLLSLIALRQTSYTVGITGIVSALLIGTIITGISAIVAAKKLKGTFVIFLNAKEMLTLLSQSIPLALTLIFNLIYFRIDNFILILTRPTSEVGIYGLAYKIFETVLVAPTFFMNATYPLLVQKVGTPAFINFLRKTGSVLFLASLASVLVFWFAAPLLALIRSDFAGSVAALRVLILGFPFFFLSSGAMWALIAQRKQGVLVAIYGFSMLLNIALNLWFIPNYGYMAAAWITIISEGLVLLLSGFVLRKELFSKKLS